MEAYQHQKQIISENKKIAGLFLGTGAGKSYIGLSLAQGKTLIIVPKTLKEDLTWERQLSQMDKKLDITVISKETFRRDWASLPYYDTVIGDESHQLLGVTPNVRYKKRQAIPKTSQLFEALDAYLAKHKPDRFYLCTATIIRSPMTVWGAAKLLGHNIDFYKFRDAFYFRLPMQGREAFAVKSDSQTKDKLANLVKRIGYTGQLSDYFDVPDQTYKVIKLDLTTEQKKKLKELPLEYPDPLVLLGKRHQVENGISIGNEFEDTRHYNNEKINTLMELSIEFPRMVVFVKYTAQIAQIASTLRAMGKKVLTLEGSTKDRGDVIKDANDSPECIFIAQAQVSAGWELPQYPVMVFASMSYSVVDRIQGEGRIHRANALKKNLYIDLVVKGGIDEAVFLSIKNKKDFNERIYLNKF